MPTFRSRVVAWGRRHHDAALALVLAAAAIVSGGAALFLARVPAFAGFSASVIAAGVWCRWLERHPD